MSTLYMLVGLPGTGKSTWVKNQRSLKDFVHISTDNIIEDLALGENLTYNDAFSKYIGLATYQLKEQVKRAVSDGHDIIWDQTNVSKSARMKKLNMCPTYKKIVVVFEEPNEKELTRRLNSRPGKTISYQVIDKMRTDFQYPTLDEGFDIIMVVS